ncbi:MAG: pro-sigmaK processing inhibitor BofA family protein, partial [Oscillospiraceae bacterium]
TVYVLVVAAAAVLVLLRALSRVGALRSMIPGAAGGLLGLTAVQLAALFGPSLLAANPFTLCIAMLLGIPGVVGMLLLRLIAVI